MTTETITLTDREKDVVGQLCLGLSNKEIADALHLSHKTIEAHLTKLRSKCQVHSQAGILCAVFKLEQAWPALRETL